MTPLPQLVRELLRRDPRAALLLAEILGPPPGLNEPPER